eukprot:scaffold456221_cov15-Prasinocladus_malaysianus.AAC.1
MQLPDTWGVVFVMPMYLNFVRICVPLSSAQKRPQADASRRGGQPTAGMAVLGRQKPPFVCGRGRNRCHC